jgi:hypothetical protein
MFVYFPQFSFQVQYWFCLHYVLFYLAVAMFSSDGWPSSFPSSINSIGDIGGVKDIAEAWGARFWHPCWAFGHETSEEVQEFHDWRHIINLCRHNLCRHNLCRHNLCRPETPKKAQEGNLHARWLGANDWSIIVILRKPMIAVNIPFFVYTCICPNPFVLKED